MKQSKIFASSALYAVIRIQTGYAVVLASNHQNVQSRYQHKQLAIDWLNENSGEE